ncbi:hypothetical protein BGAL_0392g00100 [Botrytis galanthina]|uniref:Uncharacterized protein n=1 Tax=Botrytis galanthina TaxID=278940 RepID=A0A4S8QQD6_9HELO|nr:hypothetical protein BGAL_0392g00100 [Botrytis galanthina]
MPTPEEMRKRREEINKNLREYRAEMRIFNPEEAKRKRVRDTAAHRRHRERMARENPGELEARKREANRKQREKIAAMPAEEAKNTEREKQPTNANLPIEDPGVMEVRRKKRNRRVRERRWEKSAALQISDATEAIEQAAVPERNNSLTSPTSDNRSTGPASPKDLEYYNTPSPVHNAAFTMTDMTTSLPPSNPGQPAHSRINLPSTGNYHNQLSMNNLGHPAPPSTHIQTANSTYYPPSTSYNNSGAPTHDNNSLPLAEGCGPARPEMPAGHESAGLGTSFAQPTSGYYYPSSGTIHEPPVPPSTTVPIVEGMVNFPVEEVNRWWIDTLARGY